jgi:predicted transglutaminase-like cysteine proteinase
MEEPSLVLSGIPRRAALFVAALASAAVLSASPASADPVPTSADFMAVGKPAKPPLGYLDFCARRPDQCGLAETGFNDSAEATRERQQALYSRYFWPIAFNSQDNAETLRPSAGDAREFWSTGFGRHHAFATPPTSPEMLLRLASERDGPLELTSELMHLLGSVNDRINHAIRYVTDQALYGVDDYWTLPLEPGAYAAGDCKDYVLEKRRALIAAGISPSNLSIAIVRTPRREIHAVLLVATDHGELVLDSLTSSIRPWRRTPYGWIERQAPGSQFVWVTIPKALS